MQKIYAGIGSRETPYTIQELMRKIGMVRARTGWLLRSGAAKGADLAFETGCKQYNGKKEIWLPWPKFNGSISDLTPTPEAFAMAAQYHPAWKRCSESAKSMHARNCHQVMGKNLRTPALQVICYTSDGKISGGTGQAMRIAEDYEIPIYNLHSKSDRDYIIELCKKELTEIGL